MTKATKYFSGVVGAVLMCSNPLVQCFWLCGVSWLFQNTL
jgi:hypothetical protein